VSFCEFCIFSYADGAQRVHLAKVTSEKQEVLSGATVMVTKDSTSAILAFGISNISGDFSVKINTDLDPFFLKTSYLGIKPHFCLLPKP